MNTIDLAVAEGAMFQCNVSLIYEYLRKHHENTDGPLLFECGDDWVIISERHIISNLLPMRPLYFGDDDRKRASTKVRLRINLPDNPVSIFVIYEPYVEFYHYFLQVKNAGELALIKTIT